MAATTIETSSISVLTTYLRSIAAAAIIDATVATNKTILKALAAVTTELAVLTTAAEYARTLFSNTILTPVVTRVLSLFRTLTANATLLSTINAVSSNTQLFTQALAAAMISTAAITTSITSNLIIGVHLAFQRVTGFLKGRHGLRRKFSSTEPNIVGKSRDGRQVGTRKRGDEDTDAD